MTPARFGDERLPGRFWAFVRLGRAPNDCWTWTGALRRGYGTFWLNGRNAGAHVVVYEALIGSVPSGREIDHVCHDSRNCRLGEDCPHRACVNPDHLQVATARSNTLRSGNPAANFARATHCVNGHEFTEENTYWRPTGGRTCKACRDERRKRYRPTAQRRPDYDTHCVNGHLWSEHGKLDPNGWRQCRECQRLAAHRRRNEVDGNLYRTAKERAQGKRPNVPWREGETAEQRRERWNAANPHDPI